MPDVYASDYSGVTPSTGIYSQVKQVHDKYVDRSGIVGTDFHVGKRRIHWLSDSLLRNFYDMTPWLWLSKKPKPATVMDIEYGDWWGDYMPQYITAQWNLGSCIIGATPQALPNNSISADHINLVQPNMRLKVISKDLTGDMNGEADVIVTAVDTTNRTFTIRLTTTTHPGAGDAAGDRTLSLNYKHQFWFAGSAFKDHTMPPDGVTNTDSYVLNYCQFHRKAVEFGKIWEKTSFQGPGEDRKRHFTDRLKEFLREQQWAHLMNLTAYSGRGTGVNAGLPLTRGLLGDLTANRFVVDGPLQFNHVNTAMLRVFNQVSGSKSKWVLTTAYGQQSLWQALKAFGEIKWTPRVDKKMGMSYMEWETQWGTLNLVTSPYFLDYRVSIDPVCRENENYFGNWMMVIDEAEWAYVRFAGLDTYLEDVTPNGLFGSKYEYKAVAGNFYRRPLTGAILTWEKPMGDPDDGMRSVGTNAMVKSTIFTK